MQLRLQKTFKEKHSKDPSKNWKYSGIESSRIIHQDWFQLMVLVATLWNRGPSINYVTSFSWFLPLPSPYRHFFPAVHHQTFPPKKCWHHLWTVPRLEIANYESYRSQQVWASQFSLMSKFCGFFTTLHQHIFLDFWPFPANK